MGSLLPQLLATGLVGALAPVPVIIAITLLMAQRGLGKAIAFAGGLAGTYVVIGAIVLATANDRAGASQKGGAVTGTIILVIGAVFVVFAAKQLLSAPDPDAAPPKFMEKLDTMSVGGALVLGLVLALINVKQLGVYAAGVSQIVAAHLPSGQAWLSLILFLVIFQIVVLGVVAAGVFARSWSERVLSAFRVWLVKHNRVISIVLGFVIGVGFVIKGIGQIIAA